MKRTLLGLGVFAALAGAVLLAVVVGGGTARGQPEPTPTPVPDPCVGVCMTGFWQATYRNDPGNIVGHCSYDVTQSGASTVWGEISCTHVSLGNLSGSLDQGTRSFDAVEEYQVPPLSVDSHGTVTPEGDSDAGGWACIAGCTEWGTYTSIRVGPHSEGEMPPVGDLTLSTALDDELTVPEGGLDPGTTVTVDFDTLPAAPPEGLVALSRAYVLGPEGATLGQPAILVIHYTVEDLGGTADPETLRVYVYNSVTGVWDLLGGTVDTGAMTLTVEIPHFSIFAVLASPLPPPTETPTPSPTPTSTPTSTLGPFTPTYSFTFDEVAPDNPDILPADDDCPVGAACKFLWWTEIADGQPGASVSGITPSSIVGFAGGALVPDGAIVGKVFGSTRIGPVGSCASEGTVVSWDATWLDATTDASTTTGSPSDLCSFSNWPTQLNDIRDDFLAAYPGAALTSRWVGCSPTQLLNLLFFTQTDSSSLYIAVWGDPTAPPSLEVCGPFIAKSVHLGLSADNPNTPQAEGGIPLRTCTAVGVQTFRTFLDRNDTPPGDPLVLDDTAICSPNTPAGSGVSVPLNGGTEALAGIDVTFSNVTSGGSTTVITTTAGPPPPTGFKIVGLAQVPLYFDINTDASYSGDLTVCIRYDESQVAGPEANVKLMQRLDSGFVNVTTSVDTTDNIICGTTTHLSFFVVVELMPAVGGIAELPDLAGASPENAVAAPRQSG